VTLLILTPPEAELLERALRRYRPHDGAGEAQLRKQVREMLSTARYTERELRELEGIAP
jgi:hypothetical protein